MTLEKPPVPEPSVVWLSLTVGFWLVLQQKPFAVIVAPLSLVALPKHFAEVGFMFCTAPVVTVGTVAGSV